MRRTGAICKKCCRFGMKLCSRPIGKCSWEKSKAKSKFVRPAAAGSRYRLQLMEKQKAKFIYNVNERQFLNYYRKSVRQKGVTGDAVLTMLESRFDNVIYRLGFAKTRAQARQNVTHGHYLLNKQKVNIPSQQIKVGDTITWHPKSKTGEVYKNSMENTSVKWISRSDEGDSGEVISAPLIDKGETGLEIRLIVEYYSRR